jgi:peptidoglycan/xylan/chitin deacetylase (PgdA/CDA1 family)
LSAFASHSAQAETVVSLDFDDGLVDGLQAASALEAHGMRGTFFIISGYLGKAGYLSADQIVQLEVAGHEIGGHTVTHPDLTTLPPDEAQRELCMGRDILLNLGLDARTLAYPYGTTDADLEAMASACGYDSARVVGGLDGTLAAELIPPADPYAIRTHASVEATDTLAEIEGWVQAAEATGGWVHLIFHRICDDACDPFSITPSNLEALLDWLAARGPLGTVVETERDVIGGPLAAAVPPLPPPPRQSANLLLNPSLEDLDPSGAPSCWDPIAWGTSTVTWSIVAGYQGAYAEQVTVSSLASGGVRLAPSLDLGHCAPPATPGHSYQVTGAYQSTASPIWVFMYRDGLGQWRWWTQSAYLPPSPGWTLSTFTTPALPVDASAVSFGLSLYSAGTLAVDDFTLVDLGPTPPAVTLTTPTDASFVRGVMTLQATASSVLGIDHVDFLVDGAVVGSSSTSPYSALWNTASTPAAQQVTARAYDIAGNSASSTSKVTVSNQAGLLQNPSLEAVNAAGVPGCWQRVGWGTNTAAWSSTTDAHAGALAQRVDVTSFASGGARLMPSLDSGPCAPPGTPGKTYTVTGWYKSSAQPVLVLDYRTASGSWVWWAQGASLPASAGWNQFTFTTPALPAGATAVSFGLSLYGVGSLTVDDFTFTMN